MIIKHFLLSSLFDIEKDSLVSFPFLQNPFRNSPYEINNIFRYMYIHILSIAAFGIEIDVRGTFPLCNRISIIRYTLLLIYFLLDVLTILLCVFFFTMRRHSPCYQLSDAPFILHTHAHDRRTRADSL